MPGWQDNRPNDLARRCPLYMWTASRTTSSAGAIRPCQAPGPKRTTPDGCTRITVDASGVDTEQDRDAVSSAAGCSR